MPGNQPGACRSTKRRFLLLAACSAIGALVVVVVVYERWRQPPRTRGEQLARTYCQSCHLFPEPALLDKASWTNGALPDMAHWLGLVPPQLERLPNGETVSDSNVFPPSPLISRHDWDAIIRYYAQAAPDRLPPAVRGKVEFETKQFRVKELAYRRQTTM